MIVYLHFEDGSACLIGRSLLRQLQRDGVRHQEPVPAQEHPRVTETVLARIRTHQARALQDKHIIPRDAVIDPNTTTASRVVGTSNFYGWRPSDSNRKALNKVAHDLRRLRALGDTDSAALPRVHTECRKHFYVMRMTNPASDPNQMLSTQDAAALLGLKPCTLAAWREDGSQPGLAFFKLGKAVRYRYADLLAFIETRKASSTLTARQVAPPPVLPVSRARTGLSQSTPAPVPAPAPAKSPQEPLRQTSPTVRPRKSVKRAEDRQQSLF